MNREEAIEVYNGLINTKIKEAFEFFAPELRKINEDEIRKDLIGGLMWQRDNLKSEGPHDNNLILPGFCLTVGKLLAYLEKQKEQVTDESDKIAAAYQLGRSDERKQKDQKAIPIPPPCWESAIQEQKPNSTEDMPYITDEHFFEREPADSFKYKLAEYMTKCCTKKEGPYGYEYGISAESILKMAKEELIKRGVMQKPALTPERLRPKFAVGDTICRPMYCDHTVREIYVRCNDPVYVCMTDEGTESHISFSEQDKWERKEQKPVEIHIDNPNIQKFDPDVKVTTSDSSASGKELLYVSNKSYDIGFRDGVASVKPAEWSEEDEEMFQFAIRCSTLCRQLAINHQMEGLGGETTVKAYENLRNWLSCRFETLCCQPKVEWSEEDEKMVRFYENDYDNNLGNMPMCDVIENRIKFKGWLLNKLKSLHTPPKQEWSEEDELMRTVIIQTLERFGGRGTTGMQIDWLKSLRPSWKPSEMHLSALLAVFNDPDNIGSQTCQLALTDLYEQLKNL